MYFNLPPPPGFCGLDLRRPIEVYQRHLPHWRQAGATYFATFHLADALPAEKRRELVARRQEWERKHPPPCDGAAWTALARELFEETERCLDAGHGACWFARPEYAAELERAILHFQQQRYEVGCYAVMGNHCHLVIRPFESFSLEDEIGALKKASAYFVSRRESLHGEFWQQETYDRIVRDEEHLYRVVQYVGANPRRAGLPREQWRRWMNPAWQAAGWDFQE